MPTTTSPTPDRDHAEQQHRVGLLSTCALTADTTTVATRFRLAEPLDLPATSRQHGLRVHEVEVRLTRTLGTHPADEHTAAGEPPHVEVVALANRLRKNGTDIAANVALDWHLIDDPFGTLGFFLLGKAAMS